MRPVPALQVVGRRRVRARLPDRLDILPSGTFRTQMLYLEARPCPGLAARARPWLVGRRSREPFP